jgi:SSS family solute:Na+ symporter
VLSIVMKFALPDMPFIHRVGIVFLIAIALQVVVSLMTQSRAGSDYIRTDDVSYGTRTSFNLGAVGVVAIVVALYAVFW